MKKEIKVFNIDGDSVQNFNVNPKLLLILIDMTSLVIHCYL